jgi:hypothetical protein
MPHMVSTTARAERGARISGRSSSAGTGSRPSGCSACPSAGRRRLQVLQQRREAVLSAVLPSRRQIRDVDAHGDAIITGALSVLPA